MNLFLPEMVSVSIVLGVVGVSNQNVEANLKKNNTLQIKNEKKYQFRSHLVLLEELLLESLLNKPWVYVGY